MKAAAVLRLFVITASLTAFCLSPGKALAAAGDLYATDSIEGKVVKFTPAGDKSIFASNFTNPRGLAFDRNGNLFVADVADGLVIRITPEGSKTIFAARLRGPFDLAFDRSGHLFVAESNGGAILRFTPAGARTTFASGLNQPAGLAFDRKGNLLVSEFGADRIVKITRRGRQSTFVPSLDNPLGMAFDLQGNLFVADGNFGRIAKFTPSGGQSTFALNGAPFGLAFDGAGNLFSAEGSRGKIIKYAADGTPSTFSSSVTFADHVAFEPINERLRNLSARGFVQDGEKVLFGGFILGGNALMNNAVLLRAIGPSLSNDGVTDPLEDPTVELRDASGALIAANNDWEDGQKTEISATGLAPTNAREAAIFAVLPAGSYTAVVRGANSGTGVAVIEVYDLH